MRKHNRLLHLSILATACFSFNVLAEEAINSGMWSDSSTWAGGDIPEAGDQVTINDDVDVVLDTSTPELGGLTISGKLSFSDEADLELASEWILVFGELEIGTQANPHTSKATITLTDNVKNEQLMGMGDRGIMMSGGTLSLHGNITNTWTKLAETAEAGSSTIEVLNADQWKVGDEIVLASTDYDPRQAETRFITAISGNSITLDEPLEYMHFGEITFDVDQRGEVGLLTRNIKVHATEDAEESYFGGHIMAMVTSELFVDGVELHRMGQNLELARYPIHWHLVGDGGEGQYVKNAAIHDTFNRCVTVHGTNKVRVENNVTYNNVGHCFFLEDGIETKNEFVHNLAIQVKCHTTNPCVPTNLAASGEPSMGRNGQQSPDVLLPSDNTVSAFWITNPDNTYIDNVAAGTDANGFWMSLTEHPNGAFLDSEDSLNTWPRRTPFREFRGNVAHSSYDGFMFDRNLNPDNTFGVTGSSHTGLADPSDPDSEALVSEFADLTAYKNRNGGIWGRGEMHLFSNYKSADNAIGFTHASGAFGRYEFTSQVVDSLFVGETENVGNPQTPEEIAYGRSLPKPSVPDFPIRGYEYYDYRHDIIDTTFMNYEDNNLRETGAISNLLFSSFGVSTNNAIENVEFVNAKPVHFPLMEGNERWANDLGGAASYTTAAYKDRDGSLGMGPNSYVLIHDGPNNSIAVDQEACEIKPTWNAAVCQGDVGRMTIRGAGGGGGFGGFGGGGFGGGPGGGANQPAPEPIVISRNGQEYNLTGGHNVRSGTTIKVDTAREDINISLNEMDKGSWVMFELPGFTNAADGKEQNSLAALRDASETSYYRDRKALWVKVVSTGDEGRGAPGGGTSLQVSR